jgi:hypothetical protein
MLFCCAYYYHCYCALLFILDQGLNNLESKTILELIWWRMYEFYQVVSEQGGSRSRDLQGLQSKKIVLEKSRYGF